MSHKNFKKLRSKKKLASSDKPVLIVSRSNKNIQGQVFDPLTHKTLVTVNSSSITKGTKVEKSIEVGKQISTVLKKLKIEQVVFNRNGYRFHGRIKALVDSVREQNISI